MTETVSEAEAGSTVETHLPLPVKRQQQQQKKKLLAPAAETPTDYSSHQYSGRVDRGALYLPDWSGGAVVVRRGAPLRRQRRRAGECAAGSRLHLGFVFGVWLGKKMQKKKCEEAVEEEDDEDGTGVVVGDEEREEGEMDDSDLHWLC